METIIRKIDKNNLDPEVIEEAGNILKNGGLVAFPTETVYGLCRSEGSCGEYPGEDGCPGSSFLAWSTDDDL